MHQIQRVVLRQLARIPGVPLMVLLCFMFVDFLLFASNLCDVHVSRNKGCVFVSGVLCSFPLRKGCLAFLQHVQGTNNTISRILFIAGENCELLVESAQRWENRLNDSRRVSRAMRIGFETFASSAVEGIV
jgi:hypothetical protein